VGVGRDGVEREAVVAEVDEQADGRVEDLLLALTLDPGSGMRGTDGRHVALQVVRG
jgi:hypothetical protein